MTHKQLILIPAVVGFLFGTGCAEERILVQVEFPEEHAVFLHSETIEITLHDVPSDREPTDACSDLRAELQSSSGFRTPPKQRYGPYGACEFLAGAELPDLSTTATLYVAAVRDPTGELIATGCEPSMIEEIPVGEDGSRRLTVIAETTSYYNTTLAGVEPPWATVDMRCGM